MMRNPFAINNGDLDGGDAGEERQRDESSGRSVKIGRGGWEGDHREGVRGKRWFNVTSSEVGTYATEGTSGATAAASLSHAFYTSDGSHSPHRRSVFLLMSKLWPLNLPVEPKVFRVLINSGTFRSNLPFKIHSLSPPSA